MALTVTDDGFIVIKSQDDAKKALQKFQTLKAERDELYEEHGIKDMDEELVALKAAVTKFMADNKVEQIECKGFHGTLVKGYHGGHWLATDDDISPGDHKTAKSLQAIIEKKFKSKISVKGSKARKVWMKITKRVVDHEAVEAAVADGTLNVKEIAPAWSEKEKAPYLRIFQD